MDITTRDRLVVRTLRGETELGRHAARAYDWVDDPDLFCLILMARLKEKGWQHVALPAMINAIAYPGHKLSGLIALIVSQGTDETIAEWLEAASSDEMLADIDRLEEQKKMKGSLAEVYADSLEDADLSTCERCLIEVPGDLLYAVRDGMDVQSVCLDCMHMQAQEMDSEDVEVQ